jgi:hypothetical protein
MNEKIYRVWGIRTQKWEHDVVLSPNGAIIGKHYEEKCFKSQYSNFLHYTTYYTGFCDNSGIKIFDGDIMEIDKDNKLIQGEVQTSKDKGTKIILRNIENVDINENSDLQIEKRLINVKQHVGKIIGNIFEHPELILYQSSIIKLISKIKNAMESGNSDEILEVLKKYKLKNWVN